ncbi:hypothetical protein [Clostridium thermobutyricum]|uniref:hypothetical protein n=1 Tax=Clostridium thermobutyricum TaxID=29372 RepID=UPI0018ABFF75|nr:hypothetical protein [Clostridium thermobutyricum]
MIKDIYYNKMESFLKAQDAKNKALKLGRKVTKMDTEINLLLLRYMASKSGQDLYDLALECEKYLNLNLKYVYDSIPIYFTYKVNRPFYESEEYKKYIESVSLKED